ncbi:hypothetical protein D3C80_1213700 [compost metagenome]
MPVVRSITPWLPKPSQTLPVSAFRAIRRASAVGRYRRRGQARATAWPASLIFGAGLPSTLT